MKGFITAPTIEQLRATPHEQHLLKVLWDWQEQSAKSKRIFGMEWPNDKLSHGREHDDERKTR
jgi:hypothetical protein